MPNLTGYEETENPGWINVKFDDGTSQHVNDPTGMFRGQISEVAAKLNPTPTAAPPIASAPIAEPAFVAPPQPEANAIFAPPSPAPVATPGPVSAPVAAPPPAPVPAAPIAAAPPVAGVAPAATLAPMKAAPGMRMSGQRRSVTGLAEEDKQVIDSANADAQGARVEADDAAIQARTNQLQAEWDRLTGDEKSKLAEQQVLKDKEARFTAKLDAQMKRNQEIADVPIDGAKAFDGDAGFYAFMAAMGEAVSDFGRALLGQPARGNPAEVIDRIMQNSIRSQTELKQEQLKQGRITVEQFDAERERIRLGITTVGKQLAETQLGKATTEQERLGLGALQKKFTAEQKDAIAKNAMATARQETREEAFSPVVVGPAVAPTNATKEALALLGVTPEQYTEGMNKKLGVGENAPTVNQTVTSLKQMDQDLQLLEAIKQENGGSIPTRGVINIPAGMRNKLAQMGVDAGTDAEEANQLITSYIIQKAKSYGGVITESDRESAELEFGKSGDGLVRGIKRMRMGANNTISQTIDTIFPGVGQEVLNLSLRRAGQTSGVEELKTAEEFGVTSGKPKEQGPRNLSDIEQRQKANREEVGTKVSSVLKPIGESFARPPSGYRGKF
jgi:hypothetical protein